MPIPPKEVVEGGGFARTVRSRGPVPPRKIRARRMSFDYSEDRLNKYFAGNNDLVWSHILAVLSALFPAGEDFFVESVRNFRDQVGDPELKRQIAGFIGQEAVHGKEHRIFNEHLDQNGYVTTRIDRWLTRRAKIAQKITPKKWQLATTAAFEHYTAVLAELLLSDPQALDTLASGEARSLFLWHAYEETEHKAVAFDTFREVGGNTLVRIAAMQVVTLFFVASVVAWTTISITADPQSRDWPRLREGLRSVRRSPFLSKNVLMHLLAYSRPGFHPDDRDTSTLLEDWRAELFGPRGTPARKSGSQDRGLRR
jgi:predicted metal-dependent hydrolase